jgi:hypothetical protein
MLALLWQVCDFLNANMLSPFAPIFARHKIDSLHKAALLDGEKVGERWQEH